MKARILLTIACMWAASALYGADVASLEQQVYGQVQQGDIKVRVEKLEGDLFGRPLPGELQKRQDAVEKFMNVNSVETPSLFYKLDLLSWALGDGDSFLQPLDKRVGILENVAGTGSLSGKPLAMRVERMLNQVLDDQYAPQSAVVQKGTVARIALLTPLTSDSPVGTPVRGQLIADMKNAQGILLAPRGAVVSGVVSSVNVQGGKRQWAIAFDGLWGLGNEPLPLSQGDSMATTFLVDSGADLPEGSQILAQVAKDVTTFGFDTKQISEKELRARYPLKNQTLVLASTAPETVAERPVGGEEATVVSTKPAQGNFWQSVKDFFSKSSSDNSNVKKGWPERRVYDPEPTEEEIDAILHERSTLDSQPHPKQPSPDSDNGDAAPQPNDEVGSL